MLKVLTKKDQPKYYTAYIEALDLVIWDTVKLSMKEIDFFQVPVGQGGKTWSQTSMMMAGVLPAPERITLTRQPRAMVFYKGEMVDLGNRIWSESLFVFRVNSRIYFKSPLWMVAHPIAALRGLHNIDKTHRQALVDSISNVLRSKETQIEINPHDPFMATVKSECVDPDFEIVIGLVGDYDRAI